MDIYQPGKEKTSSNYINMDGKKFVKQHISTNIWVREKRKVPDVSEQVTS